MEGLGLLLLRVPAGLLLAGHGSQKVFGWFGGGGPAGTGPMFESLGYRRGKTMALLAGLTELAAGIALALGLLTPLAAAAIIGVMINAIVTVHWKAGVWSQNGGYEYPLVLTAIAAGLAFYGAGPWSIDATFDFGRTGAWWGIGAVALGIASAALILSGRRQQTAV